MTARPTSPSDSVRGLPASDTIASTSSARRASMPRAIAASRRDRPKRLILRNSLPAFSAAAMARSICPADAWAQRATGLPLNGERTSREEAPSSHAPAMKRRCSFTRRGPRGPLP